MEMVAILEKWQILYLSQPMWNSLISNGSHPNACLHDQLFVDTK